MISFVLKMRNFQNDSKQLLSFRKRKKKSSKKIYYWKNSLQNGWACHQNSGRKCMSFSDLIIVLFFFYNYLLTASHMGNLDCDCNSFLDQSLPINNTWKNIYFIIKWVFLVSSLGRQGQGP